jgi:hydroxymethylpyrimidine pyrophosphatase-like HAD family hydrolase
VRSASEPKSGYKLVAVDLDGTLLNPMTGDPHPRDLEALRACVEMNLVVTIATGRLYSGTRRSATAIGIRGVVACADGSHLVDATNHATTLHLGVQGPEAHHLRTVLDEASMSTFLFAEDSIVYDVDGHSFVPYVRTWSDDLRETDRVVDHELWRTERGITAVVALATQDKILASVTKLRLRTEALQIAAFPLRRIGEDMWGMIVRASGGTKGTAVEFIARANGLTLDQCVTVGDWVNDVSMLGISGRAFAMGQAPDEVKAVATDVLTETSLDGGGVARAVELAFGVRV